MAYEAIFEMTDSERQALMDRIILTRRPRMNMDTEKIKGVARRLSTDDTARVRFLADPAAYLTEQGITVDPGISSSLITPRRMAKSSEVYVPVIVAVEVAIVVAVAFEVTVFVNTLAVSHQTVTVDCFLPGTPVNTRHGGSKPIEALEVGDEVLSYNEEDQRMEYNPVARLYRTRKSGYALINDTIKVTRAHPFLVNDRWTRVEDIRPGDRLADSDLRPVAVESIVWVPETTPVFNLTVGRAHTFFVHDRLVHNKPMPMPGGSAWNMGTPDTMM